jgi:hypothetical protein
MKRTTLFLIAIVTGPVLTAPAGAQKAEQSSRTHMAAGIVVFEPETVADMASHENYNQPTLGAMTRSSGASNTPATWQSGMNGAIRDRRTR